MPEGHSKFGEEILFVRFEGRYIAYLLLFRDTYPQLLKAYVAMSFVNATIHWLPFMVHFTTLAIAYLSDRIKRVNQSFCQAPTDLFDLFEIVVRNELDWRIFVDNSA